MDATFGEQAHDLGVQLVLDLVDVLLELVDRPALLHRKRALGDDGTGVVVGVREVHRHARDLHAARVCVVDSMGAGEARQQRRVQVHHTVGERRQDRVVHLAHVAGHDDVVHAMALELGGDDLVRLLRVGVDLLGERERLQPRRLGTLEAKGARPRAHHELDRGVKRAIRDAVDDGLQVGPATGDEDAQPNAHRRRPPFRCRARPRPSQSSRAPARQGARARGPRPRARR